MNFVAKFWDGLRFMIQCVAEVWCVLSVCSMWDRFLPCRYYWFFYFMFKICALRWWNPTSYSLEFKSSDSAMSYNTINSYIFHTYMNINLETGTGAFVKRDLVVAKFYFVQGGGSINDWISTYWLRMCSVFDTGHDVCCALQMLRECHAQERSSSSERKSMALWKNTQEQLTQRSLADLPNCCYDCLRSGVLVSRIGSWSVWAVNTFVITAYHLVVIETILR